MAGWARAELRWTVATYYESWIKRKVPPMVRPTQARDYKNHIPDYVLDKLGDTPLCELTLDHLEDLRTYLRAEKELSTKFARNIIDGSFRAMVRDARKAGIVAGFPFSDLEWPRAIVPGPDPFTADERDRLLEYFRGKAWRVGRGDGSYSAAAHYPYYAILLTLFFTGMRPSEVLPSATVPWTSALAQCGSKGLVPSVTKPPRRRPPR